MILDTVSENPKSIKENCCTLPEQQCTTVDKEVQRQECNPVLQPPICETIVETQCQFVTKNSCDGQTHSNNVFLRSYGRSCSLVDKEVCETFDKVVPGFVEKINAKLSQFNSVMSSQGTVKKVDFWKLEN